jgi:hypothetical protein
MNHPAAKSAKDLLSLLIILALQTSKCVKEVMAVLN